MTAGFLGRGLVQNRGMPASEPDCLVGGQVSHRPTSRLMWHDMEKRSRIFGIPAFFRLFFIHLQSSESALMRRIEADLLGASVDMTLVS